MSTVDNVIDSIQSPQTTNTAIPAEVMNAAVVLGYIAGNSWLTYEPYREARPGLAAKGLVIPVSLTYAVPVGTKRCMYDIEQGGGLIANIGAFAARVPRPFYLYTFASNGQAMLDHAAALGLRRGEDFYYYAAHANGHPHICRPDLCGYPTADGTQYLFAGGYDKGMWNDYMLPPVVAPPQSPYDLFPTFVGDASLPNKGNERLTVEQTDGALEHPVMFHNYLCGVLRDEIKTYRDRVWTVAHWSNPAAWNDDRHLGWRWQALQERIERIDALGCA